jgi:Lrp/AsnC family leucine-responsive transcriptional regulator
MSVPRTRRRRSDPLPSPSPGEGGPLACGTHIPTRSEPARAIGRSGGPAAAGWGPTYHPGMLDGRDLDIVAALQEDARATYADIGRRVGLSASSVHERVRKLERTRVIRAYRADVDPEALGLFVTALIAVTPLDPTQPDDLPDRVREFREIEDCFSVAGESNYVLKVRTKTTSELEELIRRLREKGEVQTRTTIVLSVPFEARPLSR